MGSVITYIRSTLPLIAVLMLGCSGPLSSPPAPEKNAETTIDREEALKLSHGLVRDLIADDRAQIFQKMQSGFQEHSAQRSMDSIIDSMILMYGELLESEFKMDTVGRKVGIGGYDKPVRKFWYAIRTTKHEKGTVYLFVEVVPDGDALAATGFSMVTFPLGTPEDMK